MTETEDRDYVVITVPGSGEGKGSATPLKEYYGTLIVGKELSVVENNGRGHMDPEAYVGASRFYWRAEFSAG